MVRLGGCSRFGNELCVSIEEGLLAIRKTAPLSTVSNQTLGTMATEPALGYWATGNRHMQSAFDKLWTTKLVVSESAKQKETFMKPFGGCNMFDRVPYIPPKTSPTESRLTKKCPNCDVKHHPKPLSPDVHPTSCTWVLPSIISNMLVFLSASLHLTKEGSPILGGPNPSEALSSS